MMLVVANELSEHVVYIEHLFQNLVSLLSFCCFLLDCQFEKNPLKETMKSL